MISESQSRMTFGKKVSEQNTDNSFYLKVKKEDSTLEIVKKDFKPEKGYNYRVVHNLQAAKAKYESEQYYVDPEYTINPKLEFPDDKVIVKRMKTLYGITNLPPFLDLEKQRPTFQQENELFPNCIRELGIWDLLHYKSFFLTQDYQESGKYTLIANVEGKFEVISVDDRIPIYKDTLEPIWGLSFKNPWEFILIKVWAKIKGGYHRVYGAQPFEFIQAFSYSNWKYFNLAKQTHKFINHYYDSGRFKHGKIILKTKSNEHVVKKGLTPNAASYQMIAIHEERYGHQSGVKKRFVLTIRSTDYARYNSEEVNFYRKEGKNYLTQGLTLDHDVLMVDKEFLGLFSTAHITANIEEQFIAGEQIINIEKYERKAQHYQFTVPTKSFINFSILQFASNKVENTEASRLQNEDKKSQLSKSSRGGMRRSEGRSRYLKLKYILVRDNDFQRYDVQNEEENKLGASKMVAIRGVEQGYPLPRFTTFEIQYFKGYSKCSTHFVRLNPGRYILRMKSQNVPLSAKFLFNWTCGHRIKIEEAHMSVEQQVDLLHDSMVSIMHKYPHFSYDNQKQEEMISYADSFQDIGYGFTAIKCSAECNRSIIVKIDPKQLNYEGYRLKGRYKVHSDNMKQFCIKVESGQYDAVVFKKRKDAVQFDWPSKAFSIYKKEFKKPQELSFNKSRQKSGDQMNKSAKSGEKSNKSVKNGENLNKSNDKSGGRVEMVYQQQDQEEL